MERVSIHVYNEAPMWAALEAGRKWFMASLDDLARLHVASYEVSGESVDVVDVRRHAVEVRKMHPGCVLVHL